MSTSKRMLMGLGADVIDRRFGDIADFAGIGEFIDQPVRTYSSGMFLRLAFSVAVRRPRYPGRG